MTTPNDAIAVLCDEVGIAHPSPTATGAYQVEIDDVTLRLVPRREFGHVLIGVIGAAVQMADTRRESVAELLRRCLTCNGARLRHFAEQEVLGYEADAGELILWRPCDVDRLGIGGFLEAAESMLNGVENWKRLFAAA